MSTEKTPPTAPVDAVVIQRFWISWACDAQDHRPLTFPPHEAIRGWWCSGYDADGNAVLCAVVDEVNEGAAMKAIFREWPEAAEFTRAFDWRFIERRDKDWKPGDRFPPSEWMVSRLAG
jgi:hypothetical protein